MNILKYTINYGNYDTAEMPDDVLVISKGDGDRRGSRFYKINSHLLPPHDISIYFDFNVTFKKELPLPKGDWLSLKHPNRDCIYEEAEEVSGEFANEEQVEAQVKKYKADKFKEHQGLYANYCLVRRNTPKVKELNEMWYLEYMNGCVRDQVSLPYVFFKKDFTPEVIDDEFTIRASHTKGYGQRV